MEQRNDFTQAGDFNLDTVNLISYRIHGEENKPYVMDIKPITKVIELTEDIYQNCITGAIFVYDAQDVPTVFPLTGFERLELKFSSPGLSGYNAVEDEGHPFYIYKIDDVKVDDKNPRAKFYKMYFTSQENYHNSLNKLSKSYEGPIADAVENILRNELKSKKHFMFEPTKTNQKITFPYVRPFQAINSLCRDGISSAYNNSHYLFFENKDGFHLRSLESLKAISGSAVRPAKWAYAYQIQNQRDGESRNVEQDLRSALKYEFTNPVDTLNNIEQGTYANKLGIQDLYNKTYTTTSFDYMDYFAKHYHLEHEKGQKAQFKTLIPFNMFEDTNKDISSFENSYLMMDTQTSKTYDAYSSTDKTQTLQNIRHQVLTQHGVSLRLLVHGNTLITAGDIISFDMPLQRPLIDEKQQSNPYWSGRYLIKSLKHVINIATQKHQMVLSCTKDSVANAYPIERDTNSTKNNPKTESARSIYDIDQQIITSAMEEIT